MSKELGLNNLRLLESGILADVEIYCKDRIWRAHKVILCAHSGWFTMALTGNYSEAIHRRVILDDLDPDMIDMVLKYLYIGDSFSDGLILSFKDVTRLWLHASIFQLDQLRDEAISRLRTAFIPLARWLWTKEVLVDKGHTILEDSVGGWVHTEENLRFFNCDLLQAVRHAYNIPWARQIQKTLTACIFSMGSHIPYDQLCDSLYQLPMFRRDMLEVSVITRFSCELRSGRRVSRPVNEMGPGWTCGNCDDILHVEGEDKVAVIIDPFGDNLWCVNCSEGCADLRLQHVVAIM